MGRFLRGLKLPEPAIDEFPDEPVELTEDEENYIENDKAAVDEALRQNAGALFGQAMTNMMSYTPPSSPSLNDNDAKAVEETYRKAIESLRSFSTVEDSKPIVQNELTDVEKKEWADRVAAMTDAERRFILTRFSTMDLYNELGARMDKDTKYINNVRETIAKYDEL